MAHGARSFVRRGGAGASAHFGPGDRGPGATEIPGGVTTSNVCGGFGRPGVRLTASTAPQFAGEHNNRLNREDRTQ